MAIPTGTLIQLLLLALPLPQPEIARGELHPAAEACFAALVDPPPAGTAFVTWDAAIATACGPILTEARCLDAPLHAACGADAHEPSESRALSERLLTIMLGDHAIGHHAIWLQGGVQPRPLDLYTAAAIGGIDAPEMHARLIAVLLLQHLIPDSPSYGDPR